MREKKAVQKLVSLESKHPFVYVSGRYDAAYNKATVAYPLVDGPNQSVVVYDLRHDPAPFLSMSEQELRARLFASWDERKKDGFVPVPVKILQYNRCPAVAPLGVLEQDDGWNRIAVTQQGIQANVQSLTSDATFAERIRSVYESRPEYAKHADAEAQLYDGFVGGGDKARIEAVRNASATQLADFQPNFEDARLSDLLLRYKARNYPSSLGETEARTWEEWRSARIQARLAGYGSALATLATTYRLDDSKQFLLQELQLWAEAIMPSDFDET